MLNDPTSYPCFHNENRFILSHKLSYSNKNALLISVGVFVYQGSLLERIENAPLSSEPVFDTGIAGQYVLLPSLC